MVLRASGGPSILKELSNEELAMDMEDAVRLNAAGVGIQVFIGGEFESRSVHNMTRLVDMGLRYGIPVMGVTAVGKDMVRDARYFRLAVASAPSWGPITSRPIMCPTVSIRDFFLPGADRHGRRQETA